MRVIDFPACCGIKICADFGNTLTALYQKSHTPQEINDFLDGSLNNYHQFVATINSDQYKIVAPVLKKHKFKQVSKFLYAGHNNVIYTFIRMPQID